jgi:hypothetical protein
MIEYLKRLAASTGGVLLGVVIILAFIWVFLL